MSNYNEIKNRNSPNFTPGRSGRKISGITIHWWGDPRQNPKVEGVVNWLCNPRAKVSAHYVATGTNRTVYCLVNCKDTAWHAGNWGANLTTIGIECDPRCRNEDYDVVAELVADIWRFYGKLPLYPHKHWRSTDCPGNYDIGRIAALAEQKLHGGNPAPAPAPVPAPAPAPQPAPARAVVVKLEQSLAFRLKGDNNLWDLDSAPNWRAVKTFHKGEAFVAFAKSEFAGSTFYLTEYSFNHGLRNGVNAVDLEPAEQSKPAPATPQSPAPAAVDTNDGKNDKKETISNPTLDKIANVAQYNNNLLKQILDLLQKLVDKIAGIFK